MIKYSIQKTNNDLDGGSDVRIKMGEKLYY